MPSLLDNLAPSVTDIIRLDHAHVLATFHQFHAGTSSGKKRALVGSACLALEIHAQLEEEIFYPALRELASDLAVVEKSYPEHDEMRQLAGRLRTLDAADPAFETTFMELMRNVMLHAAEEETLLLPAAERLIPERLGELGARMTSRRVQLMAGRIGELGWNTLRSMPQSGFLMLAGAFAAGAYLFGRRVPRGPAAPEQRQPAP